MKFERLETKETRVADTRAEQSFVIGNTDSGAGAVPTCTTTLKSRDRWGALSVRLGWRREAYRVEPGLYAVGAPGTQAPVLVSANYKLSFDALRKELAGLDAWILVLDTKGVNVWCSAGKGTFGDAELAKRISLSRLGLVVEHRVLILPQLSATGVGAPAVKRATGWTVHFGPVHACDIKDYLAAGMKKTAKMRTMEFPFLERLKVVPLEIVAAAPRFALLLGAWILAALVGAFVRQGIPANSHAWIEIAATAIRGGGRAWLAPLAALLVGTGFVPALLPWIPFRAFAAKGLVAGLLLAIGWILLAGSGPLEALSLLLALPAISAWLAMNFTGSTTFTSLAGVKAEIAAARIPLLAAMTVGLGLRSLHLILTGA